MKYLSLVIVLSVFAITGSVYAQSNTSSTPKSYTYVMKNIDGLSEEIIDVMTISGNTIASEKLSSEGYRTGKAAAKSATAGSSQLEVTFTSDAKGTMKYNVVVSDRTIEGTILVVDANGTETTMAVRGMLTEDWNNIINGRSDQIGIQK